MIRKKFIIVFFFIALFSFSKKSESQAPNSQYQPDRVTQKIIDVTLYKKNDLYRIIKTRVFIGNYRYFSNFEIWKGNSYNGRVVSFKGENLGYFPVDSGLQAVLCSDGTDDAGNMVGGCEELPEGEILIQMPYLSNGKKVEIFDPSGKKVLTIDLTSKATCNENEKCDRPLEDSENCPQDCNKGEALPESSLSVENETSEPIGASQGLSAKSADLIIIIIIGAVLLLAGLGFFFWRRRRKQAD